MSRVDRLADLITQWRELRQQGHHPRPEELCHDCPELISSLKRCARIVEEMNLLDEREPSELDGFSSPGSKNIAFADQLLSGPEVSRSVLARISPEAFERLIADLGLVTDRDLERVRRRARANIATSIDLARELLCRDILTEFQVRKLAMDEGKSLVLGNYVLLDRLGAGGMGEVFKARHRRMKRTVAIKMLSENLVNSPSAVERFHREVETTAQLTHPNIVTAHDADEANGRHFLAMEYIEGEDLLSFVRGRGPLSIGQTIDGLIQAARGLEYAHERGIVHRDIKPSNLLVDREGVLKILDLGLARIKTAGADNSTFDELTGTGTILGTADYMAPEQATDPHAADARSDIYALGCTMYFFLTGEPMFKGSTFMSKILAHSERPTPTLETRCAEAPPCLTAIFRKMVAKNPDDRHPSATTLLAELHECAENIELPPNRRLRNQSLEKSPRSTPGDQATRDTSSASANTMNAELAASPGIDRFTGPNLPPKNNASNKVSSTILPAISVHSRITKRLTAAVALAAVAVLVAWLASVVMRVHTPHGEIEIVLEGKPIKVAVNEDKTVTITDPNDGKDIRVEIKPGEKSLTLTKAGFEALALSFNLSTNDGRKLSARFVPRHSAVQPIVAGGPSPLDKLDPKLIPESEKFPWYPKELVAVVGSHRQRVFGNAVSSILLSHDGNRLITCNRHDATIWNAATLERVAYFHSPGIMAAQMAATQMALTRNGKVLATGKKLWDISGPAADELATIDHAAASYAFARDDHLLATGGQATDQLLRLWRWSDGKLIQIAEVKGVKQTVPQLAFTPDGNTLITLEQPGNRVRLWDVVDKDLKDRAAIPGATRFDVSRDGKQLATAMANWVQIWDITGANPRQMHRIDGPISTFVRFAPDARHIVLGRRSDLQLWSLDPKAKGPLATLGAQHFIVDVAFAPNGKTLYCLGESFLKAYEINGGKLIERSEPTENLDASFGFSLGFSPDGRGIWTRRGGGEFWDLTADKPRRVLTVPEPYLITEGFSADGQEFVMKDSSTMNFYSAVRQGDQIRVRARLRLDGTFLSLLPDGKTHLTRAVNGQVQLVDVSESPPNVLAKLIDPPSSLSSFAFSQDGTTLVLSCPDKSLHWWKLRGTTWKEEAKLTNASIWPITLAVDPKGERVLARSDPIVFAFELRNGEIHEVAKHHVPISQNRALKFFPDGKSFLIGGWLGELQCWDVGDTRANWSTKLAPFDLFKSIDVAPDGRHIAIWSPAGTAYILRLPPR